ncbi:hypothetical protein ONR75_07275 [Rhodopseudomonas sp. P2A-2r]|nr:hypothetical protein [Rhodopseudomonas sp. P2A-2r]UZE50485.1 hypothetical protein ONR75_07275 [Rhodopseudomonas sp. P2A-2r]
MTTLDLHHDAEPAEPGVTGLPDFVERILLTVLATASAVLLGIGLLLFDHAPAWSAETPATPMAQF